MQADNKKKEKKKTNHSNTKNIKHNLNLPLGFSARKWQSQNLCSISILHTERHVAPTMWVLYAICKVQCLKPLDTAMLRNPTAQSTQQNISDAI